MRHVESVERRRLYSAVSYGGAPYVGEDVAFEGGIISAYATLFTGPATADTRPSASFQFALSADSVPGNEDDIPLGTVSAPFEAAWGGAVPDRYWYSAHGYFALPAGATAGQYHLVSYDEQAGYDISQGTVEVLSPSQPPSLALGDQLLHTFSPWDRVAEDSPFVAHFGLQNRSLSPQPVTVRAYLSTDEFLDDSDSLQHQTHLTLAPAQFGDQMVVGTLSGAVVGQQYYLIYQVSGDPSLASDDLYWRSAPFIVGGTMPHPYGQPIAAPNRVVASTPDDVATAAADDLVEELQPPVSSIGSPIVSPVAPDRVVLGSSHSSYFVEPGPVGQGSPFAGFHEVVNRSSEDVSVRLRVYLSADDAVDSSDVLQTETQAVLSAGKSGTYFVRGELSHGKTSGPLKLLYAFEVAGQSPMIWASESFTLSGKPFVPAPDDVDAVLEIEELPAMNPGRPFSQTPVARSAPTSDSADGQGAWLKADGDLFA